VRVYLESYGCAQNQGEGSAIGRALVERGHALVADPSDADAGILVTCGVIGATEARMVRRWKALTERVPRVVVTGCLVPLRTDLLTGPGRDRTRFVPIQQQAGLPSLLESFPAERGPTATPGPIPLAPAPPVTEEVVIAQGCTSACSYCFSRLARGPLESVPLPEVVRRVRAATARGAVEVRLTSLDTGAWGRDARDGPRLPDLLRAVSAVPGSFRVRLGMTSPQTLGPILAPTLDALDHERFYRFLHLPVQSGSDRVLREMRRGYSVGEFTEQVRAARARFPELALSTDVIVGFPGETEEDHRATETLLESTAPEIVNVTRFSPRPGTPASRLAPVASSTAKRRSRALTSLRQRLARQRLERWVGHRGPARVVEFGPGSSAVARLPNYLPVVLDGRPPLGATLEVRVDGARSTYLLGRPTGPAF
jgi:threonylcarbamoyladenosine tRNA methylthiotransferase CDKAL1